jgi:hypothetical protein
MSTPSLRRARLAIGLIALTLSMLATSRVLAYVLPVTDVFLLIRNQVISVQTEWQTQVLDQERRIIRKLGRRLSEYVGDLRARFGVTFDDPPRWRTHDFESDRYLFGRVYGAALNYGDPGGQAVDAISRPAVPLALVTTRPAEALQHLQRAYATLDIADAVLRDGTNQSGLLRFGGRSLYAATNTFEQDALDGDFSQSTSAVLDKLNGAAVLELKQKQGTNDLLVTAVEIAVLDNKRRRDAEAIAINRRIRTLQYYRAYGDTFFSGVAMDTAAAWRQP